jgi:hypothetical protein
LTSSNFSTSWGLYSACICGSSRFLLWILFDDVTTCFSKYCDASLSKYFLSEMGMSFLLSHKFLIRFNRSESPF